MVTGALLGDDQPQPHPLDVWKRVAEVARVTPFEAKALYVAGLLRHLAEAAGKVLYGEHAMWLPAYVLIADAAELLGRCHLGDARIREGSMRRLDAGFEVLIGSPCGTVQCGGYRYGIRDLVGLRNFTMHGASTPMQDIQLERDLIRQLLQRLANEVSGYWRALESDPSKRNRLAEALIRPLWTAGRPVFVEDMLEHVRRTDAGIGLLFESPWRT